MKKLTLVSIIIHGVRYSAFIEMEGNKLTWQALIDMFPELAKLPIGATYSVG